MIQDVFGVSQELEDEQDEETNDVNFQQNLKEADLSPTYSANGGKSALIKMHYNLNGSYQRALPQPRNSDD